MPQRVICVRQHPDDEGLWDIHDFLKILPESVKNLKWMIRESESIDITYKEFRDCPAHTPLSYDDFVAFTDTVFQSIWCTYLADADPQKLEHFDQMYYLDRNSEKLDIEFAFEAVDSCFWLVTARDDSILTRMEGEFVKRNLIWRGPDA